MLSIDTGRSKLSCSTRVALTVTSGSSAGAAVGACTAAGRGCCCAITLVASAASTQPDKTDIEAAGCTGVRVRGLFQASEIVRQHFDVRLRQPLDGRRHVAIGVVADAGLEPAQLRFQIGELLAGKARNVLQAEQ